LNLLNIKINLKDLNWLLNEFNINIESIKQIDSINLNNSQIFHHENVTIECLNTFKSSNEQLKNLEKECEKLKNELKRSKEILANPNFLAKAPKEKIALEKQKLDNYQKQFDTILMTINKLK
jgi:valyl-tRNA synthetase